MGLQSRARLVAPGLVLSLSIAGFAYPGASSAQPGSPVELAWLESGAGGAQALVSADTASALSAAAETGEQVEDLSQRTESMSLFAQPDGKWVAQVFTGPVREQHADGTWAALDHDLVEDAGEVRPRVGAFDLAMSDGGSDELASVAGDGPSGGDVSLGLGWDGDLPAPELNGNAATYERAAGGADLVVTALRQGFSHSVVLDERPEVAPVIRFPLHLSPGLSVSIVDTGAIHVVDQNGELVFYAPRPRMWDAVIDPLGGVPANVEPVDAEFVTVDGGPVLELTPDPDFLADSSTQYPVTIDPTWNWANGVHLQSWIQFDDYLETQHGSPELKVGTYNGSEVARTFLRFATSGLSSYQVLAAELQMFNYYSSSCTGAAIYAQRLTEAWDQATLTWANQPGATATGQSSFSPAYGYHSSCPENYVGFDVTAMAQAWVSGAAPNYGLRLRAADENDTNSWRRYLSSFWSDIDASQEPHLLMELNRRPNAAVHMSPASGTITTDDTPRLLAKATDPDGDAVSLTFEFWNKAHTMRWFVITSSIVPSGTEVHWNVPTSNSGEYHWRVAVQDAHGFWNGTWSSWSSVYVDTLAPTATSPKTNGSATCGQVIGDSTPTLSVVLKDNLAGNLESDFEMVDSAGTVVVNTNSSLAAKPSGQVFTYTTPTLPDGTYRWNVRGSDTRLWGAYTAKCSFTIDRTLPQQVDVDAVGPYELGVSGTFVADAADTDVVGYRWGLNTDAPATAVSTTSGSAKTISFTPTTFGPSRLAVRAVDGAGNLGPIRYADIWVDGGTAAHHWKLDETTGSVADDAIGTLNATFSGAYTWAGGRWSVHCDAFGDCVPLDPTDGAVRFTSFGSGTGSARTTGQAVNPAGNFSVSAWVRLDSDDTVQTFAALSQDGGTRSSFKLGYIAGQGAWGFWMRDSQTPGWIRAVSPAGFPIVRHDWVHLTGTYDSNERILRLYVDGDLVGTAELGAPHTVSGDFRIGTSREDAADTMTWPGEIDDVRVFRGMLDDGQIRRIADESRP